MGQNHSDINTLIRRLLTPEKLKKLLIQAIRTSDVSAVEVLLQSGVCPNFLSDEGKTPLHYAVFSDEDGEKIIELLIDNGAQCDIPDTSRYKRTALFEAIHFRKSKAVDALLRKGISTKTVSPCPLGMSPLLYASKYSTSEMVLCFLKAGANIRSCWIWKINKVIPLDIVTHRIEQTALKKKGRGSLIVLPRSRSPSPSPLRVKNRRAASSSPAKLKRRRLQEIRNQLQEEAEIKEFESVFDQELYLNSEEASKILRLLLQADGRPEITLRLLPDGATSRLQVLKRQLNRLWSQRNLATDFIMSLIYHGYRPNEEHLIFLRQYDQNLYSSVRQFLKNPLTLAELASVTIRKNCTKNVMYSVSKLLKYNEKLAAVVDLLYMKEILTPKGEVKDKEYEGSISAAGNLRRPFNIFGQVNRTALPTPEVSTFPTPPPYTEDPPPAYEEIDNNRITNEGGGGNTLEKRNRIPGPMGIPLLGPLHKIRSKAIHKTFESWSTYYGPLISIRLLGKKIIIVSGADEIRTVLSGKSLDFSARPEMFRFSFLTDGHTGIAMGHVTEDWLKKKKSVARALKIDKYEAVTKTIVKRLCELGEDRSHYWDLNKDICIGLINIMTSLVLGKTFDFHSKDLLAYKSAMERSAEASFRLEGVVLDAFPQLMHFNFPRQICKTMKECRNTVSSFLIKEINDVISTYKEGTCRGLVDSLYEEYLKDGKEPLETFVRTRLYPICLDVISGGYMTTARALQALILLLLHNPKVQKSLQEEVDSMGSDEIEFSDRRCMPYTNATCLEILRYISHIPLNLPHVAVRETELGGATVEPGTQVWTNFWAIHHNEDIWGDPWTFRPERFIEDGVLVKPDHKTRRNLFVFGAGRRVCVGEQLALNRLFLITASFSRKFTFYPASNCKLPSSDPRDFEFGAILKPPDYFVRAVPRSKE
ncbi:DgyrCDS8722 [Dimorphilus gyrociliatus]|uniref:DgyrCDS8722 n=1 Tax=Dimorphilus gyrociliatus TaxID=2664684 RepID=A0A7I8VWQ6_9ANNE|nr:DgyrCDS8722 [Dimorphilus gyrociliatus]